MEVIIIKKHGGGLLLLYGIFLLTLPLARSPLLKSRLKKKVYFFQFIRLHQRKTFPNEPGQVIHDAFLLL